MRFGQRVKIVRERREGTIFVKSDNCLFRSLQVARVIYLSPFGIPSPQFLQLARPLFAFSYKIGGGSASDIDRVAKSFEVLLKAAVWRAREVKEREGLMRKAAERRGRRTREGRILNAILKNIFDILTCGFLGFFGKVKFHNIVSCFYLPSKQIRSC